MARDQGIIEGAGAGRQVALVLAGAALLWTAAQAAIPAAGLDPAWLLLADMAAGAAFIWALVVTWRISRLRRRATPTPASAGPAAPRRGK